MRRAACLVAWTLILAGCSGNEHGASTSLRRLGGVPVLDGGTQKPGTKLGNGFSVAPGSVLIGDVFPTGEDISIGNRRIEDAGWRAYLLVTGDPAEMLDHYRREAERADMPLRAVGPRPSTAPAPLCRNDRVEGYVCQAIGLANDDSRARSFSVRFTRRPGDPGDAISSIPQSYAQLIYRDTDALVGGSSEWLVAPLPGAVPPPLPTNWPTPAAPGDHIDGGIPRAEPITAEPQSRAVIAPIVEEDVVGPSPNVILRIDGEPMNVLRAYERQFVRLLARWGAETQPIKRSTDDGVTVFDLNVIADSAIRLTAFARKGEPTWAILSTDVDV